MVFAGANSGDYEKVTDHVFVGEGAGSYDVEEVELHYGWKLRKCTVCCIILFAVLLFASINCFLFAYTSSPGGAESTTTAGPEVHKAAKHVRVDRDDSPYNCDVDFGQPGARWEPEMREYCCKEKRQGCPVGAYDCDDGRSAWRRAWTESKQDFCCGFTRKYCEAGAKSPGDEPYNCADGAKEWKTKWSTSQQAWCCKHYSRGCVSEQHDCASSTLPWNLEKRMWCCQEKNLGCAALTPGDDTTASTTSASTTAETTTHAPLGKEDPCSDTLKLNDAQRKHCCESKGIGCSEECEDVCVSKGLAATCRRRIQNAAKHDAPVSLMTGRCDWAHRYVAKECDVCSKCKVALSGCHDIDPYECDDADEKASWPRGKQAWCCEHKDEGCDVAMKFACEGETGEWSFAHKTWCCDKFQRGCSGLEDIPATEAPKTTTTPVPTTTTTEGMDCGDGKEKEWTYIQSQYCCNKVKKGCSGESDLYDCNEGYDTWRDNWSVARQTWCCAAKDKGCKTHDCTVDADTWTTAWTDGKKEFCCKQVGRGCETISA